MNQHTSPAWHPNHRDLRSVPAKPDPRVVEFHRSMPGYVPSPLIPLALVAAELGVARVFAKDESYRLGLPAFKALGASWAIHRVVEEIPDGVQVTMIAATDGNHGRAVAHFARLLGHGASIFVPGDVHENAIDGIRTENAEVTIVDGNYDDAVRAAERAAVGNDRVLVQDTAFDDYQDIPRWIVDGYDTLFVELDEQLASDGIGGPDLVVVPTGVGSLLQAALTHYRQPDTGSRTAVVSVEADTAACVQASLIAGERITVDTGETVMAGLNAGTVSALAWPSIAAGLDAALTTSDVEALRAALDLADFGVAAGPCGAAPLAALRAAFAGPDQDEFRRHLALGPDSTIVLLVTEGVEANPVDR